MGANLGVGPRPEGPYVPAGFISGLDGKALVARIASGEEVTARINNVALTEVRTTHNVIATSKIGDKNNLVIAGAHSDSVPAGPVRTSPFVLLPIAQLFTSGLER